MIHVLRRCSCLWGLQFLLRYFPPSNNRATAHAQPTIATDDKHRLHSILILGRRAIIICPAAEFDDSGTQAVPAATGRSLPQRSHFRAYGWRRRPRARCPAWYPPAPAPSRAFLRPRIVRTTSRARLGHGRIDCDHTGSARSGFTSHGSEPAHRLARVAPSMLPDCFGAFESSPSLLSNSPSCAEDELSMDGLMAEAVLALDDLLRQWLFSNSIQQITTDFLGGSMEEKIFWSACGVGKLQ